MSTGPIPADAQVSSSCTIPGCVPRWIVSTPAAPLPVVRRSPHPTNTDPELDHARARADTAVRHDVLVLRLALGVGLPPIPPTEKSRCPRRGVHHNPPGGGGVFYYQHLLGERGLH